MLVEHLCRRLPVEGFTGAIVQREGHGLEILRSSKE